MGSIIAGRGRLALNSHGLGHGALGGREGRRAPAAWLLGAGFGTWRGLQTQRVPTSSRHLPCLQLSRASPLIFQDFPGHWE